MAEPSLEGFSDRTGLRRALAHRLREVQPDLRILAEGFLAEISVIDLLAVGREGELVSVRFSKPDDDRATLTRALADLTWLRPRRTDFLKLSPGLGIDPSAEPRALVVCHGFSAETLAAADNFPKNTVALWSCRGLASETGQLLMLEPTNAARLTAPWLADVQSPTAPTLTPTRPKPPTTGGRESLPSTLERAAGAPRVPSTGRVAPGSASIAPRRPGSRRPLADPPSPSAFRTGLFDTDLEATDPRESERVRFLAPPLDGPFLP